MIKLKNKFGLLLSLAVLSTCLIGPANSQAQQKRDPRQFNEEPIKKMPELPYVPMYSGKGVVFVDGNNYPNVGRGKRCLTVRLRAKEDIEDIRNWYRGALPQYGWAVDDRQCTPTYLTGVRKKEGLMLNVFLQRNPFKDRQGNVYKSMFTLRYLENAPGAVNE